MQEALQNELQELQNLDQNTLDDVQKARLVELPGLIEAEKTASSEKIKKDLESALAQKEHFRTKFEKEESERKALEIKLNKANQGKGSLDVEDYIDISNSLAGLDPKEQEYLSTQHTLSGKSLKEIRQDEDFLLWQSAHRQKVEKENKTLKPGNGSSTVDEPQDFQSKLAALPNNMASLAEKEKMLTEAGLYKAPRQNPNRTNIGALR